MNGETLPLWHESAEDALEADIAALGGSKAAGLLLWPHDEPQEASRKLRRSLDPERAEKLSQREIGVLVRAAAKRGSRAYATFIADLAGCHVVPVSPEDQRAELQREFIAAVKASERIAARLMKGDA